MDSTSNTKLSFVTVVYGGELPLLELQARSMERFIPESIIEEIIILVNDINEAHVTKTLHQLYLKYYGALQGKVRVVHSAEVFVPPAKGWLNTWLDYWAKKPQYRFRKIRGGWHGNNGWAMQQAFKLCSAKVAKASHIVMLDTKNVFVQKIGLNAFVDEAGKARTRFIPFEKLHKRWLPPSFKALNVKYSESALPQTTQYTTPFVIETKILKQFINAFEQQHDSVQGVFARRFIKPTEFMLINVFCMQCLGGIKNVFAEGLIQANSFFTSSTKDHVDAILDQANKGEITILGLHITVVGRMTVDQLERLKRLLIEKRIIGNDFDMIAMKDKILENNEARVKKSQSKLSQKHASGTNH